MNGEIRWKRRYLDPLVKAEGWAFEGERPTRALTEACRTCDYLTACRGVEQWYVDCFGEVGLNAVHLY